MAPEVLAAAFVLAVAAWVMWRARRASPAAPSAGRAIAALIALAGASAALAAYVRPATPKDPPAGSPPRTHEDGYASSDACRSCHPSEHASWSRTFHRTMTQRADERSVRAPLPASVTLDGLEVAVTAEGGGVFVTSAGSKKPLVLTTGSHHYQAFWVAGARPGELALFPLVYVFREGRWLPRRDVFLQPPNEDAASGHGARWNSNCLACHAVAGRPGHDEETNVFRTREAELGVACEACHGPGAAHVAARQSPVARLSQRGKSDPTVVNPSRLSAERSAAVCGQCHAFAYPRDEATWWTSGYATTFHPGDALDASRFVLFPETLAERGAPRVEATLDGFYWSDGTIRVGGREYNGLVRSPCFERGEGDRKPTCLSCHSMHSSDPDDQLRRDRTTSAVCVSCHAGKDVATHVRHAAGSAATRCESCHMPKTTYALLKSIRSHRIESPSVATAVATGRPTACNLCHLDRSLGWTAERLREWYGVAPVAIPDDVATVPVAAVLSLRGDAAMRALVAAAMGEPEARAASGEGWERSLLGALRSDEYAAVRLIAERSVAAFPGVDARALVDAATEKRLLARRDTRAITISE